MNKFFKYLLKGILGIIIILLVGLGYLFIKYNDDLPTGVEGEVADNLARQMENALNKSDFDSIGNIEWAFRNSHFYKWDRTKSECQVIWDEYTVDLNLNSPEQSKAYVHSFQVHNDQARELIEKAVAYFNNDSFWLVAHYKLFDEGVKRTLVTLENGDKALLATYTSGGSTPGDSYLWLLKEDGKPYAYRMWTSILPFKGIEASWDNWMQLDSGAYLPKDHKLLFMTIDMGEVKAY